MKPFFQNISSLLLASWLLFTISGCNNEDDVIGIFKGKTWKLSYISDENSHKQFDFWNGDNASFQASMKALGEKNTFVLNFEGTELTTEVSGTFEGKAINAIINGNWNANGKNNVLNINNIKQSTNETDPLARAFICGLQNAFKYEGDYNNLYIYYKEGQTIKRLNLKPQK